MLDALLAPVAVVYLLVVGMLFIYGINFLYMSYLAAKIPAKPNPPAPDLWPVVTVQLPIYNEMYVAERLIRAVAGLDYPPDRLQIQVLDDSTDVTAEVVERTVDTLRRAGLDIRVHRRADRIGYKAGALAAGLDKARGTFVAIFDADFIPQPDFLRRTIPHFCREDAARLAFIQTRWGHANRGYSFLTLLQSLSIDAHFIVEQQARWGGGYWFNFNGTAGIWRREAILDAGGWRAETLTEDLDLSYRAFLCGWRALYLRDVETPAELPASFNAYRRQQNRWAQGSFECAQRYLPQIWRAAVPLPVKLAAALHLTGYCVHLLLFSLSLLYPLVLILSARYPALISLFGLALLFNVTAFAPTIFFIVAQRLLRRSIWRQIPVLLFISAAGAGMMLNTVRAAWNTSRGRSGAFERTPKFGVTRREQDWRSRRYQLSLDPIVYAEVLAALLNAGTVVAAIIYGNVLIALYAGLFCIGLLYTSGVTIGQTLAVKRLRTGAGE